MSSPLKVCEIYLYVLTLFQMHKSRENRGKNAASLKVLGNLCDLHTSLSVVPNKSGRNLCLHTLFKFQKEKFFLLQ